MIKNLPEIKLDLNITKTNIIFAVYGLIIGIVVSSVTIYSSTKNSYFKILNTKIGLMTIVHDRVYTLEEIRKCANDCQ
jgi:hypothetical protein